MAKAKAIGQPQYELLLTGEEATALLVVCELVGGDPEKTPRRHIDAIRRALEAAGAYHAQSSIIGQVRFES